MLNAEDALGLLEDLAIMRNNQNRGKAAALMADEEAHHAVVTESLRKLAAALRAAKAENASLRLQVEKSANSRNDVVAVSKATRDGLHCMIERMAEATGLPIEQLRAKVFQFVSRRYDAYVRDFLAQGSLVKDERRNPEVMKARDWYVEP